jgi:hypothetical protein
MPDEQPITRRFDDADAPLRVRRYDFGGELLRPHKRADGTLLAECIATREGILEYRQADGSIRLELVTREAVLDTARTLPRSSVTLDHPKEGFVTSANVQRLGVGDVDGEAVVEEDAQGAFVRVKVAARRKDAVDAVESKTATEVSAGYDVTIDPTPGEHPTFGRYDARQIGRDCNHLAIVPRGRAGSTVALRTDSADAVQVRPAPQTGAKARTDHREVTMNPLLIALLASLGVERFDSEDAALTSANAAVKDLKSRADAAPKYTDEYVEEQLAAKKKADEDLVAAKADAEKAKGELAALIAEREKEKKADAERKDAAELERLRGVAAKVGVKHDGLALPALRLAIAKTRVDSIDDKASSDFVGGVLAIVEKDLAARKDGASDQRWNLGGRQDGDDTQRVDGDDKRRNDAFYNPWLAAADEARKAGGAQ